VIRESQVPRETPVFKEILVPIPLFRATQESPASKEILVLLVLRAILVLIQPFKETRAFKAIREQVSRATLVLKVLMATREAREFRAIPGLTPLFQAILVTRVTLESPATKAIPVPILPFKAIPEFRASKETQV
jgi:hypothetical protein